MVEVVSALTFSVGVGTFFRAVIRSPKVICKSGQNYVFYTAELLRSDIGKEIPEEQREGFNERLERLIMVTEGVDNQTKKFLRSWFNRKYLQEYKDDAKALYLETKIASENARLQNDKHNLLRQQLIGLLAARSRESVNEEGIPNPPPSLYTMTINKASTVSLIVNDQTMDAALSVFSLSGPYYPPHAAPQTDLILSTKLEREENQAVSTSDITSRVRPQLDSPLNCDRGLTVSGDNTNDPHPSIIPNDSTASPISPKTPRQFIVAPSTTLSHLHGVERDESQTDSTATELKIPEDETDSGSYHSASFIPPDH